MRIKALMALYAFNRREDDDLAKAEKELIFSIGKTYDLYHYLFLLVIDVADIASEKIDQALLKNIPTAEDLNPNRRFVDNAVISQLRENTAFKKYIASSRLSWVNYPHIPRSLYNKLITWSPYVEYMKSPENSYRIDNKFVIRIITELFSQSEDLMNCLEEQSIYWNDDMEYVLVMVEKTLKKFKADAGDKNQIGRAHV